MGLDTRAARRSLHSDRGTLPSDRQTYTTGKLVGCNGALRPERIVEEWTVLDRARGVGRRERVRERDAIAGSIRDGDAMPDRVVGLVERALDLGARGSRT